MADTVVSMPDGKRIVTHCLQRQSTFLNSLLEEMLEDGDMVVGLDMEYVYSNHSHGARVSLLSLCTKRTCVFIDLYRPNDMFPLCSNLSSFLNHKDIVFCCVHKRDDLAKLKELYGFAIRNVGDLSEVAARVHDIPRYGFFGVRKLSCLLGVLQLRSRSKRVSLLEWMPNDEGSMKWGLSLELVECATVDAYASYKVAKHVLVW